MNTIPSGLEGQVPARTMDSITEARGFIARCQDMIEKVRLSLVRAEATYQSQRAAMIHRFNDDLDRLDRAHGRVSQDHHDIIAKLEGLRS